MPDTSALGWPANSRAGRVGNPSGGHSVAICGLAGVLAVDLISEEPKPARRADLAALGVALWSAALLGNGFDSALSSAIACIGAAAAVNLAGARAGTLARSRVALGVTAACSIVLLVRADVHGAALASGLLIGAARAAAVPRPQSPDSTETGTVTSQR